MKSLSRNSAKPNLVDLQRKTSHHSCNPLPNSGSSDHYPVDPLTATPVDPLTDTPNAARTRVRRLGGKACPRRPSTVASQRKYAHTAWHNYASNASAGRGLRLPARGGNRPPLKGSSGRTTVRPPGRRTYTQESVCVSNGPICECEVDNVVVSTKTKTLHQGKNRPNDATWSRYESCMTR